MAALKRVCRMLHTLPLLYFETIVYLALLLLASYGLMLDLQAGRTVAIVYSITISVGVCSLCSILLRNLSIRIFPEWLRLQALGLRNNLKAKAQLTGKPLARPRAQEEHRFQVIIAEKDRKIKTLENTIRGLKSQTTPERADREDSIHGTRTFSWFLHDHDINYPPVITALSHVHPSLDMTCIICFADFKYGDKVTELPCGHGFHSECCDLWLRRRFACALCQQELLWVMTVKPRHNRRAT